MEAKRPVIYAGQGVHYAEAWPQLKELALLMGSPVTTSLEGKSAFPENHPLSLGSGGRSMPRTVHEFLQNSDVIFGIGCSFTSTNFGVTMPKGKTIVHATLDPMDLNKNQVSQYALVGDAALTLDALIAEMKAQGQTPPNTSAVEKEIADMKAAWMAEWMPKLTCPDAPLNPYRVLWDLNNTVDRPNTIITHDAGSPRDQISPFWESITPLSYIGWGKTTQLGDGLGLAMGANWRVPTSSASTFGAMPPMALRGWISRQRCASGFDSIHPPKQFLDGDRTQGHASFDREVPQHRHFRRLCSDGPGLWRLRRTGHRAGRYHPSHQTRD